MELTKKTARELIKKDFVPNGKRMVDIRTLTFRRTKENEVIPCCFPINKGSQKQQYCGEIAEFLSLIMDEDAIEVIALCDHPEHRPPNIEA